MVWFVISPLSLILPFFLIILPIIVMDMVQNINVVSLEDVEEGGLEIEEPWEL